MDGRMGRGSWRVERCRSSSERGAEACCRRGLCSAPHPNCSFSSSFVRPVPSNRRPHVQAYCSTAFVCSGPSQHPQPPARRSSLFPTHILSPASHPNMSLTTASIATMFAPLATQTPTPSLSSRSRPTSSGPSVALARPLPRGPLRRVRRLCRLHLRTHRLHGRRESVPSSSLVRGADEE